MKQRVLVSSDSSSSLRSILESKLTVATNEEPILLGVSGGSAATVLINALKSAPELDLSAVKVFFCDERLVPVDNEESTFKLYKQHLIDANVAKLTLDNFIQVNVESKESKVAAEEYEERLRSVTKGSTWPPILTLAILGMGPDGHTCSLFPGHELLQERERVVSWLDDSPKPPPSRITLTLPALENAQSCVFVCNGASKASVLKNILEEGNKDNYPAGMVKPKEELIWLLDEGAASSLKSETVQKV